MVQELNLSEHRVQAGALRCWLCGRSGSSGSRLPLSHESEIRKSAECVEELCPEVMLGFVDEDLRPEADETHATVWERRQ